MVPDVVKLWLAIFNSEQYSLSQLPAILKVAYANDPFMIYETMHMVL